MVNIRQKLWPSCVPQGVDLQMDINEPEQDAATIFNPADEAAAGFRNVGCHLQEFTVSQPRIPQSKQELQ
jgi:hypothetical protein